MSHDSTTTSKSHNAAFQLRVIDIVVFAVYLTTLAGLIISTFHQVTNQKLNDVVTNSATAERYIDTEQPN